VIQKLRDRLAEHILSERFSTFVAGGGLEELEDEFNDGKIQYAFVRIIDPNTELPKLVLIGWVCSMFA